MRTRTRESLAFITAAVVAAVLFTVQFASAAVTGTIMPTSDGAFTQWTPSTGTSHFALVDETPCNGATDSVSTVVVGNRDSYGVNVASVPSGATITQVDIKPCASRVSAGGTNPVMNVFYRANGVNSADAGAYSLSATVPAELATTTFGSLSVVKGATTTLEIGAVLTSSTKGAKLSRIATAITYTPLNAPVSLVVGSSTASTTKLAWTDTASNETGFSIERSTNAINFTGVASTSANATTFTDSALTASTTYYYRVRAFNSGGYSSYTNTATTTTLDVAPNVPTGLSATATSTNMISLLWNDNSTNESGFAIERSADGVAYFGIATTTANVISYFSAGLTASTTYFYRVRAYNAVGYSGFSSTTSATTKDTLPTAPTSLSATATTSSAIGLTWKDNSTNETVFAVERSTDFVSWLQIASTSPHAATGTMSYYSTGLSPSTAYYHRVRAYNSGGFSAYTNTATATTTSLSIPAPVSYWSFDESSGNASDSTGANTLINANGATYSSGFMNNAADLSATSSQYFAITDASSTGLDLSGTDFTVSTWVKLASAPSSGGYPFFNKYSCCGDLHTEGYTANLYSDVSGVNLYTLMRNSGLTPSSGITPWSPGPSLGTWYHIALVYSNSTGVMKMYVNGTQMGSDMTGFQGIQDTPTDFSIGSMFTSGGNLFLDGSIDEYGVWNSALSAAQVAALYNGGAGRAYSSF